jgi:hypothetical protein
MPREERRQAKVAAGYFLLACQTGDEQALYNAAAMLDETYGGWTVAMRAVTRQIQSVSTGVRHAFIQIWIERKMLALTVNDHRAMCDAARILPPPYQGLAVQLFRGASAQERRSGVPTGYRGHQTSALPRILLVAGSSGKAVVSCSRHWRHPQRSFARSIIPSYLPLRS